MVRWRRLGQIGKGFSSVFRVSLYLETKDRVSDTSCTKRMVYIFQTGT